MLHHLVGLPFRMFYWIYFSRVICFSWHHLKTIFTSMPISYFFLFYREMGPDMVMEMVRDMDTGTNTNHDFYQISSSFLAVGQFLTLNICQQPACCQNVNTAHLLQKLISMPISHSSMPISYSSMPISHSSMPINQCFMPISNSSMSISYSSMPISHSSMPIAGRSIP
jgi:hypothetical protein